MKNLFNPILIICSVVLHTTLVIASPFQAKILNISTNDKRMINIQFDKKNLYAQSPDNSEVYSTTNGTLSIPVDYSPTEVVINSFYIFENSDSGSSYLGDIEFYCVSHEFQLNFWHSSAPSYICFKRSSFELPNSTDTYTSSPKPYVSNTDKVELWEEITAFRKDAPEVFSRGHSKHDIAERFSFIIQFIWSLDPPVNASTAHLNLSLMNKIRGLRNNNIGMLCGGFRNLFTEIATVLMPDVPVRHVHGCEFYYPACSNITPNTHELVEVACKGMWWLVDPTFRFYLTTNSNEPINAHCIRNLRGANRINEVTVVHIPTIKPEYKGFRFDDPEWSYDIFNRNYWCYFRWLNYQTFCYIDTDTNHKVYI